MTQKLRPFSILFKALIILLSLTGILDRAGLFSGHPSGETLFSFTSLSNGGILIITLVALVKEASSRPDAGRRFPSVRAAGVMMMTSVMVIYHLVLLPQKLAENPAYQIFTYGNLAAHYLVPLATLADWLMFDKKGRVSRRMPLFFALVPVGYFVVASLYGFLGPQIPGKGTSYVYFFIDWERQGPAGVLRWVALILGAILALGYGVCLLDHLLGKRAPSSAG